MKTQREKMSGYYRFHVQIYESTRWSFLFDRDELIKRLRLPNLNRYHLLEIGCGTGRNLEKLAVDYPNMRFTGVDVSPEMLAVARRKTARFSRRIQLLELSYGEELLPPRVPPPDIVLISYCLTMANPGWEAIIRQTAEDLPIGGRIAVVDFHTSRFALFRRWMRFNHVRMDGHLLPFLQQKFKPVFKRILPAYFGLWTYFLFVGEKNDDE